MWNWWFAKLALWLSDSPFKVRKSAVIGEFPLVFNILPLDITSSRWLRFLKT
jgi:hypothetical protein